MEVNKPCEVVTFPSGGGGGGSTTITTPIGTFNKKWLFIIGILLFLLFYGKGK